MDGFPDLNTYGYGLSHMAVAPDPPPPCGRCHGTGLVGNPTFPVVCPDCTRHAQTGHDAGE